MTSSGSGSNDLLNELGRQVGAISTRAVGSRRLDEAWNGLSREIFSSRSAGESDRQFRRMTGAASIGQSVLLGAWRVSGALGERSTSGHRASWAALPVALVGFGQVKLRRDQRLDQLPSSSR